MDSIKTTISVLGRIASALALISIIYGAFTHPLEPYVNGIMLGVIETYRHLRDQVFITLGYVFGDFLYVIIDIIFPSLPPWPWFNIPGIVKDASAIPFVFVADQIRASKDSKFLAARERHNEYINSGIKDLRFLDGHSATLANIRIAAIHRAIRREFVLVVLGALSFFFIAFATSLAVS